MVTETKIKTGLVSIFKIKIMKDWNKIYHFIYNIKLIYHNRTLNPLNRGERDQNKLQENNLAHVKLISEICEHWTESLLI